MNGTRLATRPRARREVRLMVADRGGAVRELGSMRALVDHLRLGDVVVVNDAFTVPASFACRVEGADSIFEVRLLEAPNLQGHARAVLFGPGDFRQRTEDRPAPPLLSAGARLRVGGMVGPTLHARVRGQPLGHPRLVQLAFAERGAQLWSALLAVGRPIQYSYIAAPLALFDVQTAYAGVPFAAELPSAGYGLDWSVLGALRSNGVQIAHVTHAAGISSTGDAELDARLPLQERSRVSEATATMVNQARARGQRIVAVGTSVVRALESFARSDGQLQSGALETSLRIDRNHRLRVVDGILTGMHAPGESHYDLLESFAPKEALGELADLAEQRNFLSHEFGDALLLLPALRASAR